MNVKDAFNNIFKEMSTNFSSTSKNVEILRTYIMTSIRAPTSPFCVCEFSLTYHCSLNSCNQHGKTNLTN
jgi:hypothetical protein